MEQSGFESYQNSAPVDVSYQDVPGNMGQQQPNFPEKKGKSKLVIGAVAAIVVAGGFFYVHGNQVAQQEKSKKNAQIVENLSTRLMKKESEITSLQKELSKESSVNKENLAKISEMKTNLAKFDHHIKDLQKQLQIAKIPAKPKVVVKTVVRYVPVHPAASVQKKLAVPSKYALQDHWHIQVLGANGQQALISQDGKSEWVRVGNTVPGLGVIRSISTSGAITGTGGTVYPR